MPHPTPRSLPLWIGLRKNRRNARAFFGAFALVLACLASARVAAATPPRAVVEIGAKAEHVVDALFTRRLIELELSDVDVPVRTRRSRPPARSALFYRVLLTEPSSIRVELWERGEFYGARTVDIARGGRQLHARRIALAAGELARELRQARLAEAREPKKTAASPDHMRPIEPVLVRAIGGADVAAVDGSRLLLAGPRLSAEFRLRSGPGIELSHSWLFGSVRRVTGPVAMLWRELALTPSYLWRLSASSALGAGFTFAAAALHATGGARFDEASRAADTWSARMALQVRLDVALSHAVALTFRPEFGATLRHVALVDRASVERRLGGAWLGANLGVAFGPSSGRTGQ